MAYLKGAFINLGAGLLGDLPNIVVFQFNPDRVTRTPTLASAPALIPSWASPRAASIICGSFSVTSAWSGVFVRSRRTMHDSRDGPAFLLLVFFGTRSTSTHPRAGLKHAADTLYMTGAWWLLLLASKDPRQRYLVGAGCLLGLMIATRYAAWRFPWA
jgi:hypothetical protein